MGEAVGEHHPTLRVRVVDLDRRPVERRDDISDLDRVTVEHVLRRADDAKHTHRRLQLGERRDRLDHGCAAAHVELHPHHSGRGLDRQAAAVERHRLAHERDPGAVAGARWLVPQLDQPGVRVRALCDGRERAHPARPDLVAVEDRRLDRLEPVSQLDGIVGERRRRQVVGRGVAQIPGAVLGAGEQRRARSRSRDVVVC